MNDLTLYESYRGRMLPGDVISFRAESYSLPVGLAIQAFTPDGMHSCCHVASVVTSPSACKRRMVMEATGHGGVAPMALSLKLEGWKGSAWWHPLKTTSPNREKIEAWLWDQGWKKYDFGGVAANIIGYVNADMKALWCSELCGLAIAEGIDPDTMESTDAVWKLRENKGLRPWDVVALPVFLPMVKIL